MAEGLKELLERLVQQFAATGWTELVAVFLGVAYVVMAIRQIRACWIAGGLSAALYLLVFLDARLYLQAALQLVYVGLAVSGWIAWGKETAAPGRLSSRAWRGRTHVLAILLCLAATGASAPLLAAVTDSAAPWADALGTWASVAATWMLIRRVAAAWLWWIAIDCGLSWLFMSQGLVFTALLYVAFAAMAVAGWWQWHRAPPVATQHG